MELGQAKKIFVIAKKSQNLSPRTLETYEEVCRKFFEWLVDTQDIYIVEEITPETIRSYFVSLQEKGLRGVTQHRHFRTLRTFFKFLYQNDYVKEYALKNVKPPKKEIYVIRTFTAQEISKMLKHFDKSGFVGCRNYCILCLLFSTGIRKEELLNLNLADINIGNDLIRVDGKGKRQRLVPIGRTMHRVLIQYLRMREEFLKGEFCEWLFVTNSLVRKMSPSCVSSIFRRIKSDLKLSGEKISCHTFRHTFAKNYLLNGGDLVSLQAILGHSDIITTRNYLNLNEKEIKTQHSLFNPLDNRDWLF
ncbi:MAG: tyrosine-type recombinase/integrase [Sporomusaceae bacterium]|nr:tyrosine-type recombinase/integrase [Sporomusaceae bacterium]